MTFLKPSRPTDRIEKRSVTRRLVGELTGVGIRSVMTPSICTSGRVGVAVGVGVGLVCGSSWASADRLLHHVLSFDRYTEARQIAGVLGIVRVTGGFFSKSAAELSGARRKWRSEKKDVASRKKARQQVSVVKDKKKN